MADVIRKALQTIILYRDGSQKMVTPGEIVTLTEKEHNELRQINPECMGKLDEAELALLEKTTASDSKAEQDKTESKAEPDKTQGKGGKAGTRGKEEEL
jgi:protein involved in sex pheromone biosynthesis